MEGGGTGGALNPTLLLLSAYLALTLPVLALNPPTPAGLGVGALHLAGAGWLLHRARRRPPLALDVESWLPLALVPFLYAGLVYLNQWGGGGYHDATVQAWEAALFSSNPSATWAGSWAWRPLSEALHMGYLSYYPLIFLPPLGEFLAGRAERFHRTVFAVMAAFLACYVIFIVFPVQGPRYLWTPAAPSGPLRSVTLAILESGSSRGTAFPSSHVAVAAAQAAMAVAHRRRSAPVVVTAALLLTAGTVYGGFHYAVDAVAGAFMGVGAALLALRLPFPFAPPTESQ